MATYQGKFIAKNKKFGIVVARFNEFITKRLLDSALLTLEKAGVPKKNIDVIWVPGALEVSFFCKKLKSKKWDAVIALACILRGGTYHFECVSNEITRGIAQVSLETNTPIASGVITANTLEDAIDRAGLKSGNKGGDAALSAIEIANLNEQFSK